MNDEETPLIRNTGQSNINLYLVSCGMLLGSLCTGFMLGISSPLITGIQQDVTKSAIPIAEYEASLIGSLLNIGGIVGGFLAGSMMQSLGRRSSAILSVLPYTLGLLLISYAVNAGMIYTGRVFTGVAMSFSGLIVPTYLSEVSTQELRGMIGSVAGLAISVGIFSVYLLGAILPWRWLPLATAFFPLLFSAACLTLPETPRFLLLKKQPLEAAKALQLLRGKAADIADELAELKEGIDSHSDSSPSWNEIFLSPSLRSPLLLSMTIMLFQQFGGINCVMFYANSILMDAGFTSEYQLLGSLLIVAVRIFFTLIACATIDRIGRKVLLSVSGAFMALSMGCFGIYFQLNEGRSEVELAWFALLSMATYIAFYSIGLGPIPWIIVSELLPVRARGKCGSLVASSSLLCSFIVTSQFYNLQNIITTQGTFWFFAGNCVVSVIFTILLLPETKGKSLEEIAKNFE